jgi:GNAT superfamily N-acetyltransferase
MKTRTAWTFHRLTPERWDDLEALFGERGACGGCWCMVWRRSRSRFEAQKGEGNKGAFRRLVKSGGMPGVLAYVGGQPVGWCAVAPREDYPALARSRVLKPVDDAPVWSITCLFIAKPHRRQGLSAALLEAAAQFARSRGAKLVEGYPVEPSGALPDPFVWTGLASAFRSAGFTEVARRSPTRPIMRRRNPSPGHSPRKRGDADQHQGATGSDRGVGSRRPSR